jgi:hypothetical protein
MRGPKTEAAILKRVILKRVDEILAQHRAEEWVAVDIKWDAIEEFTSPLASQRQTPHSAASSRKNRACMSGPTRPNIARSQVMDGIFPLTTNTKETPADVFKIYKYQPRIGKRHVLLKSTLEVAPDLAEEEHAHCGLDVRRVCADDSGAN